MAVDDSTLPMLRTHAEAVLLKRKQKEDLLVWSLAGLATFLCCVPLRVRGHLDFETLVMAAGPLMFFWVLLFGALHARLQTRSARATVAARRKATSGDGPISTDDDLLNSDIYKFAGEDPKTLPAVALLDWLGVVIDAKPAGTAENSSRIRRARRFDLSKRLTNSANLGEAHREPEAKAGEAAA